MRKLPYCYYLKLMDHNQTQMHLTLLDHMQLGIDCYYLLNTSSYCWVDVAETFEKDCLGRDCSCYQFLAAPAYDPHNIRILLLFHYFYSQNYHDDH